MTKIHDWGELSKVEPSKTHFLEIEVENGCGWITPNDKSNAGFYLSTHTFYNKRNTSQATKRLKRCGFDIRLISWE